MAALMGQRIEGCDDGGEDGCDEGLLLVDGYSDCLLLGLAEGEMWGIRRHIRGLNRWCNIRGLNRWCN